MIRQISLSFSSSRTFFISQGQNVPTFIVFQTSSEPKIKGNEDFYTHTVNDDVTSHHSVTPEDSKMFSNPKVGTRKLDLFPSIFKKWWRHKSQIYNIYIPKIVTTLHYVKPENFQSFPIPQIRANSKIFPIHNFAYLSIFL